MSETNNNRGCHRFEVSIPAQGEVAVLDKVTKFTREFSGLASQVTGILRCNSCIDASVEAGQDDDAPGTSYDVLCRRSDSTCRLVEGSGV